MSKHLLNVAEMRRKAGAFLPDVLSAKGNNPVSVPGSVHITEPATNPHAGEAGVHDVGVMAGTILICSVVTL